MGVRIRVALSAVFALLLLAPSAMASAQTSDGNDGSGSDGTGSNADSGQETVGEGVVGTVESQRFRDGPDGTVFTLTDLVTEDGETKTIETHGGIRSDGIGQYTSHQPAFALGERYVVRLLEAPAPESVAGRGQAAPERFWVVGGEDGVVRIDADGAVSRNATPDNFLLLPYSWAWTLPDNPPVVFVNPNTPDVGNEISLMRAAMDAWENDPGSSMDWTYGGTSGVAQTGNDGVSVIYWGDTPNPADTYLARSTTFYIPSSGQAVETDIHFNTDFNWTDGAAPGAFDVLSVGIHEVGHSLGLDHAPNNAAIMFFSIPSNTSKRVLSLGDRGGVAALYPQLNTTESVSGTVDFNDGAVAPDVKLNLFTENRAQFLGVAFSDSGGNYSFELPSAGCYVMTFIAPEGVDFLATGNGFQNQPFCADPGQAVTGINARLIAPGLATTSTGRVTFADGSPAPDVKLNLFTENRANFIGFTDTDANGDYSFNLLGAGCYVTTFIAPDGDSFVENGSRFVNRSYCAGEGQTVPDVDAVLVGAASQATLGGQVVDSAGAPVVDVRAVLYRAAADGSRGQWVGPGFTNGNGDYRFTVAAGCYVLDLAAPTGGTWAATGGPFQRVAGCVEAGESLTSLGGTLN